MVEGSCLCGTVRWQVSAEFARMSHCHCSMCRKAHGAAFATFAAVDAEAFVYLAGEESLTVYASSSSFERPFCRHCGSAAPHPSLDGKMSVPVGCLDGSPGMLPQQHIFTSAKAPWHTISDELPRYDGYPNDMVSSAVPRAALPPVTVGVARGSCLCGAVRYELDLPFSGAYNCHCLRCRKARAAAHTTNGRLSTDGFRFLSGADKVQIFKLPGAQFFAQAFCTTCGSGMPRADLERGTVVVPLGSLDDDPSVDKIDHIFVDSKASWYEIGDGLKQFAERPD
jgi:hypothetical protein